jgi:hypothetical protein
MNHPLTPPPELVQQWWEEADQYQRSGDNAKTYFDYVAAKAAQWGADQELEACCRWLNGGSKIDYDCAALLRAARRPKPPSLKEEALEELAEWEKVMDIAPDSPIRRALEALPND